MIHKLSIVEEEADETAYWLEILVDSGQVGKHRVAQLISEANEIVAMTVASIKTLRKRLQDRKSASSQFTPNR